MEDFIKTVERQFPDVSFDFKTYSDCMTAVGVTPRVMIFVSKSNANEWVVNVSPTFYRGVSLDRALERAGIDNRFWDMVYSN